MQGYIWVIRAIGSSSSLIWVVMMIFFFLNLAMGFIYAKRSGFICEVMLFIYRVEWHLQKEYTIQRWELHLHFE